jgi:hypothetical protein
MARENHIVLIDDHRIQKSEFPDARGDLPYLLLGMGPGIPRIRIKRPKGKPFERSIIVAIHWILPSNLGNRRSDEHPLG